MKRVLRGAEKDSGLHPLQSPPSALKLFEDGSFSPLRSVCLISSVIGYDILLFLIISISPNELFLPGYYLSHTYQLKYCQEDDHYLYFVFAS